VGTQLAEMLTRRARLTVTDWTSVDVCWPGELGARVVRPGEALRRNRLLVPAALGGHGRRAGARAAFAGRSWPANNQLAEHGVASAARPWHSLGRITWASAGGVIFAVARELRGATPDEALRQVAASAGDRGAAAQLAGSHQSHATASAVEYEERLAELRKLRTRRRSRVGGRSSTDDE